MTLSKLWHRFARFMSSSSTSTQQLPKLHRVKNTTLLKEIITPELIHLKNTFNKYKYELKIAGGAVRDLELNIRPHDIDLATNALPNDILDMFEKEKIRVFNLNGIRHGTVAVRVNDKVVHV